MDELELEDADGENKLLIKSCKSGSSVGRNDL